MKYTVLLSGNNKTIMNEFFTYMDFSFECLSCSNRFDDVMNHLKYVRPDVFVYCLRGETPDDIRRFCNIERKLKEKKIPIVVIGDYEDCEQFERIAVLVNATILRKPISSQNIEAAVIKMLEAKGSGNEVEKDGRYAVEKGISAAYSPTTEQVPFDIEDPIEAALRLLKKMDIELPDSQPVRKHILVVDDDSSVLKLIKSHLSERYDVATAISGKVAMKFLENKRTDLILLDYEMPEENGAAILNKIRSSEKLKDLPVVFLTGVSDKEKIKEVLLLKPQGYLLKPIDMERLSATIEGILE